MEKKTVSATLVAGPVWQTPEFALVTTETGLFVTFDTDKEVIQLFKMLGGDRYIQQHQLKEVLIGNGFFDRGRERHKELQKIQHEDIDYEDDDPSDFLATILDNLECALSDKGIDGYEDLAESDKDLLQMTEENFAFLAKRNLRLNRKIDFDAPIEIFPDLVEIIGTPYGSWEFKLLDAGGNGLGRSAYIQDSQNQASMAQSFGYSLSEEDADKEGVDEYDGYYSLAEMFLDCADGVTLVAPDSIGDMMMEDD